MNEALQSPLSLLSSQYTPLLLSLNLLSSTDSDDSEYESATETELSISGKLVPLHRGIHYVHVLLQPG